MSGLFAIKVERERESSKILVSFLESNFRKNLRVTCPDFLYSTELYDDMMRNSWVCAFFREGGMFINTRTKARVPPSLPRPMPAGGTIDRRSVRSKKVPHPHSSSCIATLRNAIDFTIPIFYYSPRPRGTHSMIRRYTHTQPCVQLPLQKCNVKRISGIVRPFLFFFKEPIREVHICQHPGWQFNSIKLVRFPFRPFSGTFRALF